MAKVILTKAFINALPSIAEKEVSYTDAKQPGLYLRHFRANKSFRYNSTMQGKPIKITIGQWPDVTVDEAREKARHYRVMLDKGIDPRSARGMVEPSAKVLLLSDMWLSYSTERAPRLKKTSITGLNQQSQQHEVFLSMPLIQLSEHTVLDYFNRLKSPSSANLFMRNLRACINWGMQDDTYRESLPTTNPVTILSKKKLWHKEQTRDMVLNDTDIPTFFNAVSRLQPNMRGLLLFLFYTGSRFNECQNMEVDDVRGQITFKNTKNGDDRIIPLTKQVREVLEWWKPEDVPSSYRVHMRRFKEYMGMDITAHDLRRSFATLSEWCEIPTGVVMQIMGHKPSGVHEANYRKRPVGLLRPFLERFNEWLESKTGLTTKTESTFR